MGLIKASLFHMKKYHLFLFPALIVLAVLLSYWKILHAGINNWDDAEYVFNNPDIRSFSNAGLWFTRFYIGNYHPLTMASYALDWMFGGESPFVYHLTNILLHTANGLLVYLLVRSLFKDAVTALCVALLFCLHPVQTESVSWIAERKNVLYGFFFLSSCLTYLKYIKAGGGRWMLLAFVLGVCSLLSKGAAISLPFSWMALDLFSGRPFTKKSLLEKLPMLAIVVTVGYAGMLAQKEGGFLNWHADVGIAGRIVFGGYAYVSYIATLFFPFRLSVWYPYPSMSDWWVIAGALVAVFVVGLMIFSLKKKWAILSGGLLFFSANIFPVLQFVQFGESLRADRYLYIACLGIFIPVVFYLRFLFGQGIHKTAKGSFAVVILMLLGFQTWSRNHIWLSEVDFWKSVLDTYPNSAVAQYSLGAAFLREGDIAKASAYINDAVASDPDNYKAWYNRAVLNLRQKNPSLALEALNRSISLFPYSKALFTRALLFQQSGQCRGALTDVSKVLEQEPGHSRAWFIRASCLEEQNDFQGSLSAYDQAVRFEPQEPMFYMRRGIVYAKMKQMAAAIKDLDEALRIRPSSGEYHYWRGMVRYRSGQNPCTDLHEALKLGFAEAKPALDKICK